MDGLIKSLAPGSSQKGGQTQRLCIQQSTMLVAAPGLLISTATLKDGESRGIVSLMDSKEQDPIQ